MIRILKCVLSYDTLLFVALNIFDALLTKLGLSMGGKEWNILMYAWGSNVLAKMGLSLFVGMSMKAVSDEGLIILNILMCLVLFWNISIIMLLAGVPIIS